MNWILVAILAYVLAQLGLAFWVSRRISNEEDYLVAGRSLGPALTMFTVFATWFGAETCIGAAGAAHDGGIRENTTDPFGYGLCLVLMGAFFAARLWRLKLTTLGDLFLRRYGARAEKLAVLLLVPGSLLWAAAQIRAFGQVLSASSELGLGLTITLAAGVVIVYTAVGGLRADAVTDLVQGLVLVAGILLLAILVFTGSEGLEFSRIPAEKLRLTGGEGATWDLVESLAIPLCGSVFAAELVARVVAARSAKVARGATLAAGGLYLGVGAVVVSLGLAGTVLLPGLESGEQVLVKLAESQLALPLYILFAGGLISAILSTVDSALLVAGSLVARNLLIPVIGLEGDARRLRWNRGAVVILGFVAYGLAFSADSVYGLVEEASAFGSAGVFICVLLGLFGGPGGERAALLAMGAGALSYIAGISLPEGWVTHPYLVSLGMAAAGFLLGLGLDRWRGSPRPVSG